MRWRRVTSETTRHNKSQTAILLGLTITSAHRVIIQIACLRWNFASTRNARRFEQALTSSRLAVLVSATLVIEIVTCFALKVGCARVMSVKDDIERRGEEMEKLHCCLVSLEAVVFQ
jgi:uncharacterized membrane protein YidH (DUF202 family)